MIGATSGALDEPATKGLSKIMSPKMFEPTEVQNDEVGQEIETMYPRKPNEAPSVRLTTSLNAHVAGFPVRVKIF